MNKRATQTFTLYSPAEYPEVEFTNLPSWADEWSLTEQVLEQERDNAAYEAAEARMDYDW